MSEAAADGATTSRNPATIAVIIPTFNQARFLAEAITSVLTQTRPADEIIVVDDGSTDDPAAVVARFQNVELMIQRHNRGPSAARNLGLHSCKASYVVFVDADDRLVPTALEGGLACITVRPDCAFVYGGRREISEDGRPISPDHIFPIEADPFLALIRRNSIHPPAVVLFRRDRLLAVKGFDETLRQAEDYDLYVRIAERFPIASHQSVVAEYRKHGKNATNNHVEALQAMLHVLHRHEARLKPEGPIRAAFRQRRTRATNYRVREMLITAVARWGESHDIANLMSDVIQAARCSPRATLHTLIYAVGRRTVKAPLRAIMRWWQWIFIAAAR